MGEATGKEPALDGVRCTAKHPFGSGHMRTQEFLMFLRLPDEHRRSKRSPDRSAHIVRARLVRPETSESVIKQAITTMWNRLSAVLHG